MGATGHEPTERRGSSGVLFDWHHRLSKILPEPLLRRLPKAPARLRRSRPAVWGNLRRMQGFSPPYGEDRGQPIDRYYIEQFLDEHRHLVTGRGLEVTSPNYLRMFGHDMSDFHVVDITTDNSEATLLADLCEVGSLPADAYDCEIITQTLHFLPNLGSAMANLYQALAPGGSLLLTGPTTSPTSDYEHSVDKWRFFPRALEQLARECADGEADLEVFGYGNRVSAVAFLMGLALEDLRIKDLDPYDPLCPMIAALRLTKPG